MARIRVTLWIGSVEPVDIGQQNQKRCMQHRSHLGGERVVVADLQLLNRDRIVLIDDRNRTAPEQDGEGAEDVFIAAAVLKVTAVQKNLRARNLVRHQIFRVFLHQKALADSSGSLFIGNFRRPFFKAETGKACGDRTGGNENHMVACRLQRGKLGRNVPYFFSIHGSV